MKNKGRVVSLLVSALLLSLIIAFIPQTTINQETTFRGAKEEGTELFLHEPRVNVMAALVDHDPITIDGNSAFHDFADAESLDGDGNESDPYIIQWFQIDLDGEDGHCVDISNTDIHFVIKECNFTGAKQTSRAGIHLDNVTNCEVLNNTFFTNYDGINCVGEYISIVNNTIDGGGTHSGIFSLGLNHSVISGNNITDVTMGINILFSHQCEIAQNSFADCYASAIAFGVATEVTISDNVKTGSGDVGAGISDAHNFTLMRNAFSYCYYGIYLIESTNNYITNCTLQNNTEGIHFENNANSNYVELCEILDSEEYGIEIESDVSNNLFKLNTFRNSTIYHVDCNGIGNVFDFNYYDNYTGYDFDGDGIGESPHILNGGPSSIEEIDYHPLVMKPTYPVWNPTPSNQYLEFGESLSYDLDITSPVPVQEWGVSDTTHFTIDANGLIQDIDVLDVGTYPVDVVVTNTFGLSIEASFSVNVDDTIDPTWISQIKNKTYAYGESIEFQMTAWDLAGIDHWTISDSDHFSLTESSYADTSIATIEATSTLTSGAYPLTITVYDNYDNSVSAQFYVNVGEEATDTNSPIWIVLPHDAIIQRDDSFYQQVGAWDESGIASWNLTGSSLFTIDENGVITNTGTLTDGIYNLEVRAYDPAGNYCSAEFTSTVIEIPSSTTTTPTTTTDTVEVIDTGFIMGTAGVALAVVALIMGIGAFLNTRKGT